MIDLSPHLSKDQQKKIGPLFMSHKASMEMYLILSGHGAFDFEDPKNFAPIIADTVGKFLTSAYFEKSTWFRRQPVHRTSTVTIMSVDSPDVAPIFHLQKTDHGYSVVSVDEAPLSEHYYEERVIEETKVELGIT